MPDATCNGNTLPLDALTATLAEELADPPVPLHVSVKTADDVRAPVDWLPLVDLLPLQPPDAVHDVALLLVQLSVELPPLATVVGLAVRETVGAEEPTVTATDFVTEPPLPVQLRLNVLVDES